MNVESKERKAMSNPALDKLREITARNVANGGAIYGITAEDVMRETRAALDDGLHYDADVLERVATRLATGPTRELGTIIYKARGVIGDEARQRVIDRLLAEGWQFAADVEFEDGERYMLRNRTTYVGQEVPTYHAEQAVRAVRLASKEFAFVRKGASKTGWSFDSGALVREGWTA